MKQLITAHCALITVLSMAMFLIACGDDDKGEESLEAEACRHAADGPVASLTAASLSEFQPPDATAEHTRIDLTLPSDDEAGFHGTIGYLAREHAHYQFYVSQDLDMVITHVSGQIMTPEAIEVVGRCTELAVVYTVELLRGAYLVQLSSDEHEMVSLVVENQGDTHAQGHTH